MESIAETLERRTTSDLVFEQLFDAIVTLRMLPGTKLSEAEIAKRFGVSRQPVRDAFNKLEAQDLLLIRPQKATQVRGFSMERIEHARFVRLAVEVEVVRSACTHWQAADSALLSENLSAQKRAIEGHKIEKFHRLDYEYHRLICSLAGHKLAFETIQQCKRKVDRLCVLSLGRQSEAQTLLEDHENLADALRCRDAERAADTVRLHLGRLDETIEEIHIKHSEYFE